jgi:ABC-type transport system involved in multi-copper enzyme maturation permease subunit
MNTFLQIVRISFLGVLRDKVLHVVMGVAFVALVLVPVFSQFSLRQVRELSISLSLSFSSFTLVLLALLLGASTLWRDIERRSSVPVLGLPLSRGVYLLGRFFGVALFLMLCGVVLALAGVLMIWFHQHDMSSGLSFSWAAILLAFAGDILKAVLLCAVTFLFSTLSTSLFLPIFGTLAVLFAGSASQDVMHYLSTEAGQGVTGVARYLIHVLYYLLPNLEAFNYKTAAVYGLPLPVNSIPLIGGYFCLYTAIVLLLGVIFFSRKELA